MSSAFTKASLPEERRRLLELLQQINFGRIENLQIRHGNPVLDGTPRIFSEIKFGGDNGPRPELTVGDFVLKQQVVEMFDYFDRVRDARVEVLIVKHGLPFGMHVETSL